MRGFKHFIVHIPEKYKKTFSTESGVELHADRLFSMKRVANTVVEVVDVPLNYAGSIKPGDSIFMDPTVLSWGSYVKGGELENRNLIDRDKQLYRVEKNMIIMHCPKNGQWTAYNDNLLLDRIPVKDQPIKSSILHIPDNTKKKFLKGRGKITFVNQEILGQGVHVGDNVFLKTDMAVDIWFKDKHYMWSKNKYLMAVELKKAV